MIKSVHHGINLRAEACVPVSEGTHRTEHLIKSFWGVIQDTPEGMEIRKRIPDVAWEDPDEAWWEKAEAEDLLEELFELMQDLLHEGVGVSFSAHPGDGACFAYWEDTDGE